jgi:tetratricopeptide (TPR) repeat protein
MRKRRFQISLRAVAIGIGAVALAATGTGLWLWLRPRPIDVCVITDYSYRQQRSDWYNRLEARFREVNRIFSGSGVYWRFFHANEPDPTRELHGMELRREKLSRAECRADIILEVSGNPESNAAGDVAPFAHTAIVVDDPRQPEPKNVERMAHGMATLFGAPVDPAGSNTVMTVPPESDRLPSSDRKLISALRAYDFRAGTDALRGPWGDRALRALTDAFAGHPGNPQMQAHRVLGMAFAADQDYKSAISHLREVARLDASNPRAHIDLGNVLQHDFQYRAAVAEYREAARLAPKDPEILATLGLALSNAGLGQEAVAEFAQAVRLKPDFALAQAGMAYSLSQQLGRVDEAIAAYQTALTMNPGLKQASEGLAQAQSAKQAAAGRVASRRQRAQERPQDALAQLDLGVDLARAGQVDAAIQEIRRAVQLNPTIGRAHADLALLLFLRKDYDGALAEALAAQKNGFNPPADLMQILQAQAK